MPCLGNVGGVFYNPHGIALAGGSLYVADYSANVIRRLDGSVTVGFTVTDFVGTGGAGNGWADATGSQAQFYNPDGLVADAAGAFLYVADANNHVIRQVSVPGGVVKTIAGTHGAYGLLDGPAATAKFHDPRGLTFDASGNLVITDQVNGLLRIVSGPTTASPTVATWVGQPPLRAIVDGPLPGAMNSPDGITFLAGAIYATDTIENVVVVIR
jgi:DNA-binding beta-propeller fold protein YncE